MSECEHVVIQKTYQYDRQKNITGEYWICVGCKLRFVPMGLAEAENEDLRRNYQQFVDVMNESHGVMGLHLNDEMAEWDWLINNEWLDHLLTGQVT